MNENNRSISFWLVAAGIFVLLPLPDLIAILFDWIKNFLYSLLSAKEVVVPDIPLWVTAMGWTSWASVLLCLAVGVRGLFGSLEGHLTAVRILMKFSVIVTVLYGVLTVVDRFYQLGFSQIFIAEISLKVSEFMSLAAEVLCLLVAAAILDRNLNSEPQPINPKPETDDGELQDR